MLHQLPIESLGPRGEAMAKAIETCVHCGFCLPTCPTYEVLGDEADSPRGRILLMKEVLEGKLDVDQATPHIDRCLGCVACETHCPSGVHYGSLLSSFRASHGDSSTRGFGVRLRRKLASWTLPYPRRFALAMRLGKLGRALSRVTPSALRPMLDLIPDSLPESHHPPEHSPASGERRGEVMLHLGCAAQVLGPDITAAAIRVLNRNGIAVAVPKGQVCCGALDWHVGNASRAGALARRNLSAFSASEMPIISTAAGCGSGMHEYPLILAGETEHAAGERFASRVIDVSVYLDRIGIEPPPGQSIRVAYHDACHLAHAQKVRNPPRDLLRTIPGLELVELGENDLCCGSAGTYNIDQPEIAGQLGERKARRIIETGCDLVALGNIGCQIQIERHLRRLGSNIPVLHTIQVIDRAYRSEIR